MGLGHPAAVRRLDLGQAWRRSKDPGCGMPQKASFGSALYLADASSALAEHVIACCGRDAAADIVAVSGWRRSASRGASLGLADSVLPRGTRASRLALATLCGILFLTFLDTTIMSVALYDLQHDAPHHACPTCSGSSTPTPCCSPP